jgi:lipid II:glycine glycyltransferase (peptidoglycan interpeptide bridge formation enzyme)
MYAQTAARDGFIIREEEYYLRVWAKFMQRGMAIPLIAEVDKQTVAGLVLFIFGKSAWYLYGMSTQIHRDKMPNYLLQWVAMQKAKAAGCERYDLWGAPDIFDESDSMYGVFRFKDGLGGEVLRTSGAWDFVVQPFYYFLYQQVLPKILSITRWFRKGQIKQEVS